MSDTIPNTGYHAHPPLARELIVVGARVNVPRWERGEITGWTNGTVIKVQGTRVDPSGAYVVRLDAGEEVLYFGYSIGAEVVLGPDADTACPQCGRTGDTAAPLYARPHERADRPGTPCKFVRIFRVYFRQEDVHDGDFPRDDTVDDVTDCTADEYDTAADQAVSAIEREGLTFSATGNTWAAHPDGTRDAVRFGEYVSVEVSAHLYGFTFEEQTEIAERIG